MADTSKQIRFPKNIYLLFAPFLVAFIILIFFFHSNVSEGDESRFTTYAENLSHGFFSPPAPDIDLGDGPGYPIIIMPLVALGLPHMFVTLLNAFFFYFSIIFLYKALRSLTSNKIAIAFAFFWAFFYNIYEFMFVTVSEVYSFFLVTAFIYCCVSAFVAPVKKKQRTAVFFAGFTLGMLVLTKVIFGYVLMILLLIFLVLKLLRRASDSYKKAFFILVIAFGVTSPYLLYTYQLTGKTFYWGSSGGNNLYWMTTPYPEEYGSWCRDPTFLPDPVSESKFMPGSRELIEANHLKDFKEIYTYKGSVAQDDAYRRIALRNIKAHPLKFIKNCVYNAGRILFNFPFSYKLQNPGTLLRIPINGLILVLMLFSLFPTIKNWRQINFAVRFLVAIAVLYLCGSVLGSAETRMFTTAVPFIFCWIAFVLGKMGKIKFNFR